MVFPLIPILATMAAGTLINAGSSLYQQNNYRQMTSGQNVQYRQWIRDYEKNTGRHIRYDRLPSNASGQLYANQYGINNSYAQSIGTFGSGAKSLATLGLGYNHYLNRKL